MNTKPNPLAVMERDLDLLQTIRNDPEANEESTAALADVTALLAVTRLARRKMAHRFECGVVRPASEWAEHGSWNYEGCCCDIKQVDAALARFGETP
jgi:hypothetical protein